MAEFDSETWARTQLLWVIQAVAADLAGDCVSVSAEKPVRDIAFDLEECEYLCELIHGVFPLKVHGLRLDHDFVVRIRATDGGCRVEEMLRFIDDNYEVVRVIPVNLMGRPCLTAGVFRTLQHFAHCVNSNLERFGPSSRVLESLRGRRLREFMQRIHVLTCGRIEQPAFVRRVDTLVSVCTLISLPFVIASLLLGSMLLPNQGWIENEIASILLYGFVLVFGSALIGLGLQELYRTALETVLSFLPSTNLTFRDLARDIARSLSAE